MPDVETLISSAIATRKLLNAFERSASEQSILAKRGVDQRRMNTRAEGQYQVLQRTLSNLSASFYDSSRNVDIDTSPIDLFVIDRSSVEIRAVISAVDIIIEVLETERRAAVLKK